jgi:predicted 3-demethylubiquinone-9 3-methyltransferase (glyoxalase superfamily)
MQKIVPCLWFDKEAEEAIKYYISIFNSAPGVAKNSMIVSIQRYPEEPSNIPVKGMEGKILTAIFELNGQRFMALDGGPLFKFTEAISLYVECVNQEEVDYFWGKLSAVPESEVCGWLKDKYGISWQIIPKLMGELLSDKDKVKAKRVMDAMLKMKKIIIKDLEKAYKG